MAASFSKDDSEHKEVVIDHDETQEVNIPDIHHQYFTVATNFLKDAISESAKVKILLLLKLGKKVANSEFLYFYLWAIR